MVKRVKDVTHLQHVISHDAFGLDQDLVDHGVTVITVHLMDAVLVEFGQGQDHLQGESLRLLTVAQLHRLDSRNAEPSTHFPSFNSTSVLVVSFFNITLTTDTDVKCFAYS